MFELLHRYGWYDKLVLIIGDDATNSMMSSVIISAILTPLGFLLYWISGGEPGDSVFTYLNLGFWGFLAIFIVCFVGCMLEFR